jgi:hypothetical protein
MHMVVYIRIASGLPINVTHDHRDYMGLTDTLRGTELAPTHVHTYVHSGAFARPVSISEACHKNNLVEKCFLLFAL